MSNRRTSGGRPTAGAENRNSGGGGGAGVLTINGNGNAAQTIAGAPNSGLAATSVGGVTSLSQVIAAEWPVANARVYAIDGTLGSDINKGFADPVTASAPDFAIATQQAGLVAKATFAGLAAIFPRDGSGHRAVIVIKTGTYVNGLDAFLAGCHGYSDGFPLVRGTGTNATAASVAFDGSVGDGIFVGAVTATGMNATGYNPTAAATLTSLPATKVGGGSPAYAGGLAVPLGWRIRFDTATTTVALRNHAYSVAEVPNATTLVPAQPFDGVPVATDVFYLEMAGVNCAKFVLDGNNNAAPIQSPSNPKGSQIVGINCLGANVDITGGLQSFTFCGAGTFTVGSEISSCAPISFHSAFFYVDPFGNIITGGGFRSEGNCSMGSANYNGLTCFVCAGATLQFNSITALQYQDGCAANALVLGNSYCSTANSILNSTGGPTFGVVTPLVQPPIIRGHLVINGSSAQIRSIDIQSSGATPAIQVRGAGVLVFTSTVTGSAGNNDVGLDLTLARGAMISVFTTPTITGALGDVRLADGSITSWAQLSRTGIVDTSGNRIYFQNNANPVGKIQFTGVIFGAPGATLSYCSNAGFTTIVANEVTAFRRPTSLRFIQRLRVNVVVDTSVNPVTVTLYRNGIPAIPAMSVNIPAATPANTKFVASAVVLFTDVDDLDLRMDDGVADPGGIVRISAALEYPI